MIAESHTPRLLYIAGSLSGALMVRFHSRLVPDFYYVLSCLPDIDSFPFPTTHHDIPAVSFYYRSFFAVCPITSSPGVQSWKLTLNNVVAALEFDLALIGSSMKDSRSTSLPIRSSSCLSTLVRSFPSFLFLHHLCCFLFFRSSPLTPLFVHHVTLLIPSLTQAPESASVNNSHTTNPHSSSYFSSFTLAPDSQPADSAPPPEWKSRPGRVAVEKVCLISHLTMNIKVTSFRTSLPWGRYLTTRWLIGRTLGPDD